jgi:hypothetical protein
MSTVIYEGFDATDEERARMALAGFKNQFPISMREEGDTFNYGINITRTSPRHITIRDSFEMRCRLLYNEDGSISYSYEHKEYGVLETGKL